MAKKNQNEGAEGQLIGAQGQENQGQENQGQENQGQENQGQENQGQEIAAVRVLSYFSVDGEDYQPNDLVEFPAKVLATISPDVYDVSREAVEYCVDQGFTCKRHPSE